MIEKDYNGENDGVRTSGSKMEEMKDKAEIVDIKMNQNNKRKSGVRCCIKSCRITQRTNPELKLFVIPKERKQAEHWANICNINLDLDLDDRKRFRVCSRHFDQHLICKRRLRKGATPTLFLDGIKIEQPDQLIDVSEICTNTCNKYDENVLQRVTTNKQAKRNYNMPNIPPLHWFTPVTKVEPTTNSNSWPFEIDPLSNIITNNLHHNTSRITTNRENSTQSLRIDIDRHQKDPFEANKLIHAKSKTKLFKCSLCPRTFISELFYDRHKEKECFYTQN